MAVTSSIFTISTVPFQRGAGDVIPLQYIVWNEDSLECAQYLPTVHQMMTALSELFGPYPFDKYGMTAVASASFRRAKRSASRRCVTSLLAALATVDRAMNAPLCFQVHAMSGLVFHVMYNNRADQFKLTEVPA